MRTTRSLERGGYWYHKLHIYLYPFYYINYTLTTMGAMEFKKKYAEDKDAAWQDYLNLCKTGGSRSYLETLRYANLSNPFDARLRRARLRVRGGNSAQADRSSRSRTHDRTLPGRKHVIMM